MTSSPPFVAYAGADPFVFASYAHVDRDAVYPILEKMHTDRVRIWYDEGIPPSEKWKQVIAEKILECVVFVVFITPRSVQSENVLDEISFAEKRYKKKEIQFFSIFLEPTAVPAELDLSLGRIQALFKFDLPDAVFYRKIYQALKSTVIMEGNAKQQEMVNNNQLVSLPEMLKKWIEVLKEGGCVVLNG